MNHPAIFVRDGGVVAGLGAVTGTCRSRSLRRFWRWPNRSRRTSVPVVVTDVPDPMSSPLMIHSIVARW
jgi:hypothetical protein